MNSNDTFITFFKLTEEDRQYILNENLKILFKDTPIAYGKAHLLVLNNDGTVSAYGDNDFGQCNVGEWKDITQIMAGDHFSVGLKNDGTLVAVGDNTYGQCNVNEWRDIVKIVVINSMTLGFKNNGDFVVSHKNLVHNENLSDEQKKSVPQKLTEEEPPKSTAENQSSIEKSELQQKNDKKEISVEPKNQLSIKKSKSQQTTDEKEISVKPKNEQDDNLRFFDYSTNSDGSITINRYRGSKNSVKIPNNVTRIGANAFYNNDNISNVNIPYGVVSIGAYAFKNCPNLYSIIIPETLQYIGVSAFDIHTKIKCFVESEFHQYEIFKSYMFGDGNDDSKSFVLADEKSFLYTISSDDTVTIDKYIGNYKKIIIPSEFYGEKVVAISDRAFLGSKIEKIKLPDTLESIGQEVFVNCKQLSEISLPKNIKNIGLGAFQRCSSLKKILLPCSITRIPSSCFFYCSNLEMVKVPLNVKSIGKWAFLGCDKLNSIIIPSIDKSFFEDAFEKNTRVIKVEYLLK